MKSTVFFLSLILFFNILKAENHTVSKERMFLIGAGSAKTFARDKGMSPMAFRGVLLHGGFGFDITSERRVNQFKINVFSGNARSRASSSVSEYQAEVIYRLMFNLDISTETPLNVYAGPSIQQLGQLRDHHSYGNNSLNYIYNSNIGLTGRLSYPFEKFSREWLGGYDVNLPLLNFIIRPFYTTSIPAGYFDQEQSPVKGFIKSGEITSINKYTAFSNTIFLQYKLMNNNALQLKYEWNYLIYRLEHPVASSTQSINFSIMFNF